MKTDEPRTMVKGNEGRRNRDSEKVQERVDVEHSFYPVVLICPLQTEMMSFGYYQHVKVNERWVTYDQEMVCLTRQSLS